MAYALCALRYAPFGSATVFARRDPQNAPEGAADSVAISESAHHCNQFKPRMALLQTHHGNCEIPEVVATGLAANRRIWCDKIPN